MAREGAPTGWEAVREGLKRRKYPWLAVFCVCFLFYGSDRFEAREMPLWAVSGASPGRKIAVFCGFAWISGKR
jgi:hypothetical protein